ncbi:MAG: flagellar M-ring protein FliF [Myxococcaceae bacterium]|nr:flagellar M-ring protein FliF [Myxococcaceae bacterium]
MEPLQKQLLELPRRLAALSRTAKVGLALGVLALAGLAAGAVFFTSAGEYQYAYTNLTTEDAAEVQAQLKTAGVPFRLEAGGTALAVPASRVYDVRLLLAAAGLPRSGGAGFELFDKGDFGVSEFTQKVNLRRATEGELARTIGRVAGVRSARVHLVLAEKGVFRGEERPSSAAVMISLQPGRTLSTRELAGLRHLVASAVPSLAPGAVTIVDGRGSVLTSEENPGEETQGFQRRLERDLETRVVSLLEPVVGAGQVVVRVNADVDSAEVTSTQDAFDPEGAVLKSERTSATTQNQETQKPQAVVGAAANQPLAPTGPNAGGSKMSSTGQEETRNFEVSRTTTRTVQRAPRVSRLSVAVLVDGVDGKPRSDPEVQRLGELARRAVGFDPARGDQLEISSAAFAHAAADDAAAAAAAATLPPWAIPAAVAGAVVLLVAVVLLTRRGKKPVRAELVLRPGASVGELETEQSAVAAAATKDAAAPVTAELPAVDAPPALPDLSATFRDRARELAKNDPSRAAQLIRAWVSPDGITREANHG